MTLRWLVSLFAVGVSDIPETYGNDFYRQCDAYQSYFGDKDWGWNDWNNFDWYDWYYYWDWIDWYSSSWYDWYYYWDYYYWYSDFNWFTWYSDWGSFDWDSDWNTDWDWYGDDSDWYSDNAPNTNYRWDKNDTSGNGFYNGLGPGTWPDFCDEYFRHHMNNSDNVDELYNATQTQSERDDGGETFVDQQTETFVDDENGGTAQSSTVGPGIGKPVATVDGEVVLSTVQSGKSLICSEANLAVNGGTWSILFDVLNLDGTTATLVRLACHDQRRLDRILRRMQEVTFTVAYSVEFVDTDAAMVFTVRVASESTATATTFETEAATVLGVDVTASFPPPSMAVDTSEAVALVSACRGLPVIIPFLPLCSALW